MDMQTINPPNSDILLKFNWVRVVFCFRDSARAFAPSGPILLSEYGKYYFDLIMDMQTINPSNSDIPSSFSWVRVVFMRIMTIRRLRAGVKNRTGNRIPAYLLFT